MRKIGEITDQMKKILLLLPIILLFLTGCADQTDFDEDLFEISHCDATSATPPIRIPSKIVAAIR